jgi:hypothetical protein
MHAAELAVVSFSQRYSFQKSINELLAVGHLLTANPLLRLDPFWDTSEHAPGVLRVSGRISHVPNLTYDAKFPLLLHAKAPLTALIALHVHTHSLNHIGGVTALLAELNKTYWIPTPLSLCKAAIKNCVTCRTRDGKPTVQKMAPLPPFRVPTGDRDAPFKVTAIDVAGPFFIRCRRTKGKKDNKRWMLVFRCAAISAVHFELLQSMDTSSFLLALDNFLTVRPRPALLICDNGSNFKRGAFDLKHLQDKLAVAYKIDFRFGPPDSPHHQGLVERYVQAAKKALFTCTRTRIPTEYEMISCFHKAASYLNNLPLAYQRISATDVTETPLTPNHFLIQAPYVDLSVPNPDHTSSKYIERFKAYNKMLDHFWKRFVLELSTQLREYRKWTTTTRDVQIGDIAVLIERSTSDRQLVKIVAVEHGTDGHVRRVSILKVIDTKLEPGDPKRRRIYKRSITNIVVVLPSERQRELSPPEVSFP